MPQSTETCIFDFLRTFTAGPKYEVQGRKTYVARVRQPIDQWPKDRGTLDPLITLRPLPVPDLGP
jgi:hypothetical protein